MKLDIKMFHRKPWRQHYNRK